MRVFLLLILFPGVCSLSSSVPRQFHVVKEKKTWLEAQQYCREEFTDLATIDNMEQMKKINRTIQDAGVGEGWKVWIGLKNGHNLKWRWTLADKGIHGENGTEFWNWETYQPEERPEEIFGCVNWMAQWYDTYESIRHFICYNGTNSTHPYVIVKDEKTWTDAQRYCREKHIDLASVTNQAENDKIKGLVSGVYDCAWIGLFRDAWEWSDGSNSSFRHSAPGEPLEDGLCVEILSSGLWNDLPCDELRAFVCYEARPRVKVVSPPPPFFSGDVVTLRCDVPEYTGQDQYVWLKNNNPVSGSTGKTITVTLPGQYQCHGGREGSPVAPYVSRPLNIMFKARREDQVVSVRLQVKSGLNVEDKDVQAALLEQIGRRLKDKGLSGDPQLSWRKQKDGKVFHKERNDNKKKRDEL